MPWNQEESTPRERGKVARIAANDGLAELAHKMPLSWCECLANVGGFKPFCRHDCKRRNPILSSSSNRSNKKIWSQSLLEFISCTTDSTRSPCSWPEQLWPSPKRRIQRGQNGQNPSARIILCVWIRNRKVLEIKWIGFGSVIWKLGLGDFLVAVEEWNQSAGSGRRSSLSNVEQNVTGIALLSETRNCLVTDFATVAGSVQSTRRILKRMKYGEMLRNEWDWLLTLPLE